MPDPQPSPAQGEGRRWTIFVCPNCGIYHDVRRAYCHCVGDRILHEQVEVVPASDLQATEEQLARAQDRAEKQLKAARKENALLWQFVSAYDNYKDYPHAADENLMKLGAARDAISTGRSALTDSEPTGE